MNESRYQVNRHRTRNTRRCTREKKAGKQQERLLSGRGCGPWQQASALHKVRERVLALAAQAHLLAHLIIISPRSYFATTIRVRTTVWNMELTALFHFSLLPIPLPRALATSAQELSIASAASPEGPASVLYVLPFKPAISM